MKSNFKSQDLVWTYFKASGAGGQHRNKVETGVRLCHLPTGLVVSATERRSREQNRQMALLRLHKKLETLLKPVRTRRPTKPGAKAKERRLQDKRLKSDKKSARKAPPLE